jgi:uncharacterized protein YdeI (YjbR/CyaY-like superfamily)
MKLKGFASQREFRKWLKANHGSTKELLVRCYKAHAKEKGLTYREALDEALCFGWIDGVRRSVDADSFSQRFTPRRPRSKWSAVNIQRAKELEAEGRMHEAGLRAFAGRETGNCRRYSFEEKPSKLDPASARAFRANPRALEVLQGATGVVPADQHLLGDGRPAAGDSRPAPGRAHRPFGTRRAH